ncbi:hypothetical protein AAII07_03140 [Microvirga sp. 0TCS3.31]
MRRLATALGALALSMSWLTTMPAPANAAVLTCGRAVIEGTGSQGYVVHSCVGNGRVKYRVDCLFGGGVTFYYTYRGGASIHMPVNCGWLDRPITVRWNIE